VIVAVLDTNVLVSAFPAHGTVPATLIDAWRQGAYHLVVSEHILEELAETWRDSYWRTRFSPTESAAAIALLRTAAIVTSLTVEVSGVATHPEDDLILATALAGEATYLVTGDRKLRAVGTVQDVTILSPRDFLGRLAQAAEQER
jgi:putative PIN family toxin of toxin-antitoxin system